MAINRVIIEGNLTRDVEMRATASGLAVAGFTVAVNEKRKNAEGEYVDAPVFVKCSLFGTRAEKLSKYLLKGTKVTIDGKLRYSQWVKDDEKRHELSVIVDQLEFSGGKREQTGDASVILPPNLNSTSMTRTSRSRVRDEAGPFAVGWVFLMLAVILAAASISHDSMYIFARRKMTRARVLQIGFLLLLAVMFLIASFSN